MDSFSYDEYDSVIDEIPQVSKIKLGIDTFLKNLSHNKVLLAEDKTPFKAWVTNVVYLRISDGVCSISAIFSDEWREEFKTKFEYLSWTELINRNIMINKYSYIIHPPTEPYHENYRDMWLQIVIHSLKPLLNERPLNSAVIDVLEDESIRAGLMIYKFKRMQSLIKCPDKEFRMADMGLSSISVSLRSESENSQFSLVSNQLNNLAYTFDKMDLSERNQDSSDYNSEKELPFEEFYDLNIHTSVSGTQFHKFNQHFKSNESKFYKLISMNLKKEIDSILKNSKTYIQEMSEEDSKQQLLKERMEVDKEYKELQKKASRNVSKDPIIQTIKTILAKPNESNINQQTRMISSRAESMKAGITKFLTGPYAHFN